MEIKKPVHWVFCGKFNSEQLLFEAFFDIIRVVWSIQLLSEPTFPFDYIIRYQKWKYSESPSSTAGGDRDTRPLSFLWEIQFWTTFIWNIFRYNLYCLKHSAFKWTYRVIHLKCPKCQELRRVKDAFNPPTKFAMWPGRQPEIHGYFFSSIGSVLKEIRNIKTKNGFDNTSMRFHCGKIFEI